MYIFCALPRAPSVFMLVLLPSTCRFVIHSTEWGSFQAHIPYVSRANIQQPNALHHVLFACFSDVYTENVCVPGVRMQTIALTDVISDLTVHPGGKHSLNQPTSMLAAPAFPQSHQM